MSIIFRPVNSGPLHVLPAIAGPNTKATVTCQNVKLGSKVALAEALFGVTYTRPDLVESGATVVGQALGSKSAKTIQAAQITFTEWDHNPDTTYRTNFAQRNPITGLYDGQPANPQVSFVVPFADAYAYYRIDTMLWRLKQGGVLRIISAIAS